jgi:hypothetical protein
VTWAGILHCAVPALHIITQHGAPCGCKRVHTALSNAIQYTIKTHRDQVTRPVSPPFAVLWCAVLCCAGQVEVTCGDLLHSCLEDTGVLLLADQCWDTPLQQQVGTVGAAEEALQLLALRPRGDWSRGHPSARLLLGPGIACAWLQEARVLFHVHVSPTRSLVSAFVRCAA